MTLDDCEDVFRRALSSDSVTAFCKVIEPLFNEYKILSLKFGRGSIFWRARPIENEIYPNVDSVDYPPPESAKQGRLNDLQNPCFYIAARKETALAEVGASEGQLVQLAGFRILNEEPIMLAVIGEYANVQKSGYMHFVGRDPDMVIAKMLNASPRHEAFRSIYIDKFFASVLADPQASRNGYMFSRALARSIYARVHADGIVFPSVKDQGGYNIGIQAEPSDRSFHNVSCFIVRMGKPRQFGLIDFTIVKYATHLDSDGNFIWSECTDSESVGMYNMSKEEFDAASLHPNDRNALLHILHSQAKHG